MKQVLITGGTGFIGSRLARACLTEGARVRILGQANTLAEEQNLQRLGQEGFDVILGSVVNRERVDDAVRDVDVVYHLAAAQHEAEAPNQHFHRVNVDGTKIMLEASIDAGVKRFVHGSTIGVYQSDQGIVRNDSPTVPDNIYGITKLEAERVVLSFQEELPVVIIRISETYGPGDRRLLKLFRTIQKKRYFHVGASRNLHHPVYVDDLVRALRLAGESGMACGQTIVVPGYEVVTTREMVTTIAGALDVPAPSLTLPLWPFWITACLMEWTLRPIGIKPPLHRRRMHFFVKSFAFSAERAHSLLGYEPRVNFSEGVNRTMQWYQQMNLIDAN